jgi:P-type Cu+ transporter
MVPKTSTAIHSLYPLDLSHPVDPYQAQVAIAFNPMHDPDNTSIDHPSAPMSALTELTVAGMNCGNCARHVNDALREVRGVASVDVQLERGRAIIRWQSELNPEPDLLLAAVKHAGYNAVVLDRDPDANDTPTFSPLAAWRFNVIFGAVLTLPLIVGEWILGLGAVTWFKWFGFAVAAPVMVVCGRGFFRGAWQQLKRGASNMDTLVALGSSTAFGYSVWGLVAGWPGHLYFMEAAAIVTLISTGHWLEAIAGARASDSLRALMDLTPPTGRRLGPEQVEYVVPVADLRPGDVVAIRPGDRVPTDGTAINGTSTLDESMLTGESRPIDKSPGDTVFAGTINLDGHLHVRVSATGETTALAQIITVVRRAQTSRANIQRLADRVSNVFVPIVVVIALATALWWGLNYEQALSTGQTLAAFLWHVHFPATALAASFIHAAAVLIVACPCAMGLATPAAIMAGTNAAARRGILIRDGQALEKSGQITTVIFDKTGTLTEGHLTVAAYHQISATDSIHDPRKVAIALAQPSNHPLSRALSRMAHDAIPPENAAGVEAAATRTTASTPFQHWRELRGLGVEAQVPAEPASLFRLGSLNWLAESGVDLAAASHFTEQWTRDGATVLGLAHDSRLLGLFALHDRLKPRASNVVRQLIQLTGQVYLITGDQRATALAVAAQAGIPPGNVFADVRAEQKAGIVEQLQRSGHRVAFVGDGINDAPALEQADLGIAVSKATDVAREAADIILLNSDIQAIPEAIALARATLRTIRQNLFWAFFYNAAAVPLAALGFLSPVLCAAAMGFSDLIVIGNSLRLRRYQVPPLSYHPPRQPMAQGL